MLGAQMVATFSNVDNKKFKLFYTSRKKSKNKIFFDVFKEETYKNIKAIKPNYIINCGLDKTYLDYVVDDAPIKRGKSSDSERRFCNDLYSQD